MTSQKTDKVNSKDATSIRIILPYFVMNIHEMYMQFYGVIYCKRGFIQDSTY